MPEIEIKDKTNKVTGKLTLSEKFDVKGKDAHLHDVVVNFLANQRQGNASTKTKGLVSGGGKKPWKQKHTGRARSGSSRSPIWRGGGTTFGPLPRDYYSKMPKQARRAALMCAVSRKISDGEFVVVDELRLEAPKTKEMVSLLATLELSGKTVLIVIPERDKNIGLSARNLPGIKVMTADEINTYEVLVHNRVLATKAALERIEVRV